MKASRFLIAVLLLLLVLPLGVASAQEASPYSGVFIQNASSGTLIPRGDSYVLTLSGVSAATPWIINTNQMNVGRGDTADIIGNWEAAPDNLQGLASLRLGTTTLFLTLSEPAYDPDLAILTFTASVDDIFSSEDGGKDGAETPASFDSAVLFITVDRDFLANLEIGSQLRSEGLRGGDDDDQGDNSQGNPLGQPGDDDSQGEQSVDQPCWPCL